MTNLSKYQASQ